MSEAKHIPIPMLPWRAEIEEPMGDGRVASRIYDAAGKCVWASLNPMHAAIIPFIVTACNSHEALLIELQACTVTLEYLAKFAAARSLSELAVVIQEQRERILATIAAVAAQEANPQSLDTKDPNSQVTNHQCKEEAMQLLKKCQPGMKVLATMTGKAIGEYSADIAKSTADELEAFLSGQPIPQDPKLTKTEDPNSQVTNHQSLDTENPKSQVTNHQCKEEAGQ